MKRFPGDSGLVAAIVGWLVTFAIGISQNSAFFLTKLWDSLNPVFLVCFIGTWTWTNVLFLACFAALAGEWGRSAEDSHRPQFRSAVGRGFFVYLAFIAGQLVLNGTLSQEVFRQENILYVREAQYFRIGAFASLISFMAGFNPVFFSTLLAKVEGMATQSPPPQG
jgi:hypothetical protein